MNSVGSHDVLGIKIADQWPSKTTADTPEEVPEKISRYYQQAMDSLWATNFDAAGVMFRKVLEVATRDKVPTESSKPLIKRIDRLAADGLITKDMGQWAHQIRLGGNEAAHDDEPLEAQDAQRLATFTEAFLRYAHTLPAMVNANTPTLAQ